MNAQSTTLKSVLRFIGLATLFHIVLMRMAFAQASQEEIASTIMRQKSQEPVTLPAGVSSNWYENSASHIRQREYLIRPVSEKSNIFVSANSKQHLGFRFTPEGYSVKNIVSRESDKQWQFNSNLIGLSRGGKVQAAVAFKNSTNNKNQLEYHYDGYTVQYINDRLGMRQNFIVSKPVAGQGEVEVVLEVSGDLQPKMLADNQLALHVSGNENDVRILYDDVKVWDANNNTLQAKMSIRNNNEIVISVEDSKATYPITIDPLNHTPDWTDSGSGLLFSALTDLSAPLLYGYSVSGAGDLNNDGFDDVVIGAPTFVNIINLGDGTFNPVAVGAAFVYFGSATGLSAEPNEVLQGTSVAGALFGFSVSAAGDVNGDGRGDLIIGAPGDKVSLTVLLGSLEVAVGKVYIYHGTQFDGNINSRPTAAATISLKQSDFGTLLTAPLNPLYGFSVSTAGDVNNDGKADIIVGAPAYIDVLSLNLGGRADIYNGSASGISSTPSRIIKGGLLNGLFGYSVSTAGKVNSDNYSDVIVGAPASINLLAVGAAYIFHGSASGITATSTSGANTSLSAPGLLNKTLFGMSVSNAGDVNNDGRGDVIIGEPLGLDLFTGSLVAVGKAHIFYGSTTGVRTTGSTTLTSPRKPGILGLITGNLLFGFSVSGVRDMNCDGIDDVIIGEPGGTSLSLGSGLLGLVSANVVSGQAYIFYGKQGTGPVDMPGYTVHHQGGSLSVANLLGSSVKGAGDINGDGRADFLVGAPNGTLNLASSLTGILGNVLGFVTTNSIGTAYGFEGCINSDPIAANDVISTNEDVAVTINILGNDIDLDGSLVASTIDLNQAVAGVQTSITTPEGTWSVNAAGQVLFTPTLNYNGLATLIYTVKDNLGAISNTATITVTVIPVNDAPVAVNDVVNGVEDTQASVVVVLNDTDVDGTISIGTVDLDPATAGIQTSVTNTFGTWTVDATGKVTFTPVLNFNGVASIKYVVSDNLGLISNEATITVTMAAVNDAPVAVNDDVTGNEDEPIVVVVVSNDTDVDGTIDPATVDLDTATPGIQNTITTTEGTWTVDATGKVTFMPKPNFNGVAVVTYTVNDNGGATSNAGTISATVTAVNDAPVAVNDNPVTNEDVPAVFSVTTNDTDVDGTINTATVDLDPSTAGIQNTRTTASGSWSVNASGVVTFTPVANFFGTATISYTVNDDKGAISNEAVITVTVNSVNDAPVAVNDNVSGAQNTPVTFNVVANDTDVDGSIDAATVDLNPGVAGIQSAISNANGSWSVDAAGSVTFSPAAAFLGTTSITYTVNDNNGLASNVATISVTVFTVIPPNSAPVANNDTASANQGENVTINVTANDTDSDGTINSGTVDLDLSTPGLQGSVTTSAGTWTANNSGIVTFVPNSSFHGTATVSYTVQDNAGTTSNSASITIQVNAKPVAVADNASVAEDASTTIAVTLNDTDADGTINKGSVDLNPAVSGIQNSVTDANGNSWSVDGNGVVTFVPVANWNGTTSISYVVNDNAGATSNSANITVTVTPVNDAPVAVNDNATIAEDAIATINVVANDTDIDGTIDPATVDLDPANAGVQNTITTAAGTWTVNNAGVVSFQPKADFNGSASVTYTVKDNGGAVSNVATISVTVNAVNDAPVANNDNAATDEDQSVTLNVVANDTDVDGTINAASVDLNPAMSGIQNSMVTAEGTWSVDASGNVTYAPYANFNGTASVSYVVNDNNGLVSNPATISVLVNPVNDAPVANNDAATTDEGTSVTFSITANDTDLDGTIDPTTVDLNPATPAVDNSFVTMDGSFVMVTASGDLAFIPGTYYNGVTSIQYTVKDNEGAVSNTATITITVNSVNNAPVAVDDNTSTTKGDAVTLNVTTNDWDVDGTIDMSTVSLLPGAALGDGLHYTQPEGSWEATAAGTVTFTPVPTFIGSLSISYTVKDNNGSVSNAATITITVNPSQEIVTGLAKMASVPVLQADGSTAVSFTFTVENFSDNDIHDIQITDNLAAIMPAQATYQVTGGSANNQLIFNTAYNGNSNINVLAAGSSLASGQVSQVTLDLIINPNGNPGVVFNTATVTVRSDDGTITYSDVSDNGTDPDSNGNGNPLDFDENDPTPGVILANPKVTLVKEMIGSAQLSDNCTYDVTFRIQLTNTGNADFTQLALIDNLNLGNGSPSTFSIISVISNDLTANPNYNGKSDKNLIAAGSSLMIGQTVSLAYTINVEPNDFFGPYYNTVRMDAWDHNGALFQQESVKINFAINEQQMFIPEGFSPNGDGVHDKFKIALKCGITGKLDIFNRWGEKVYHSDNYQNEWDGTSNHGAFMGRSLPEGTYFYSLELNTGNTITRYLTLKR